MLRDTAGADGRHRSQGTTITMKRATRMMAHVVTWPWAEPKRGASQLPRRFRTYTKGLRTCVGGFPGGSAAMGHVF